MDHAATDRMQVDQETMVYSQPIRVLHSQLTYRRGYSNLACSQGNILVAAKPTPLPSSVEAISGNTYTKSSRQQRSPIILAQQYHGQYAITHLEWHQRGKYMASIDEAGKLAIWEKGVSILHCSIQRAMDFSLTVISVLYLYSNLLVFGPTSTALTYGSRLQPSCGSTASDRYCLATIVTSQFHFLNYLSFIQYVASSQPGSDSRKYALDQFIGSRNPFGYLAFLMVTVSGEVIVHYQRNRNIFSSFSTSLLCAGQLTKATHRKETAPYTIFKQDSKSTLDFSLVAGRAWNSISHASLLLNDGKLG